MNKERKEKFRKELIDIISKNNLDGESNTPDFILADYLMKCFETFADITDQNKKWHGWHN